MTADLRGNQVREASPEAVEPPVGLRPVPALGMPPMQHSLDVNEPPAYYGDLKLRNVAVSLIPIEV